MPAAMDHPMNLDDLASLVLPTTDSCSPNGKRAITRAPFDIPVPSALEKDVTLFCRDHVSQQDDDVVDGLCALIDKYIGTNKDSNSATSSEAHLQQIDVDSDYKEELSPGPVKRSASKKPRTSPYNRGGSPSVSRAPSPEPEPTASRKAPVARNLLETMPTKKVEVQSPSELRTLQEASWFLRGVRSFKDCDKADAPRVGCGNKRNLRNRSRTSL